MTKGGSDDVCENCGKESYNHLAKDGHRTKNGIYCPDNSGKKFKPKQEDVCELTEQDKEKLRLLKKFKKKEDLE